MSLTLCKKQFRGSERGSKFIELEKVDFGTIYALTINPEQQPQSFSKRDLALHYMNFHQRLREIKGIDYWLFPEVGKGNKFHFHGIVQFHDWLSYLNFKDIIGNLANCEMDSIAHPVIWYTYIRKQWIYWKQIFNFNICSMTTNIWNKWLRENNLVWEYIPIELISDEYIYS